MSRSVNHVASRNRRKKVLKLTKGYFGARKNVWTVAKNTWEKGLTYAYRDRKTKKRKRNLTKTGYVDKADVNNIKALLRLK